MSRLALVLPFLVGPFAIRLAIGPLSNALAGAAIAIAPSGAPASSSSVDVSPLDREAEEDEASSPAPRNLRVARRERHVPATSERSTTSSRVVSAARVETGAGADAGAPIKAPPVLDAPSRGTIVVPASVIAKAIEKKDVGATNANGADGRPLGARIHGANRYRTGLRDGDVIVFVAGTRTETTQAMVDAATRSLAAGATKLSGKILRGDEMWDVVLELPPRE